MGAARNHLIPPSFMLSAAIIIANWNGKDYLRVCLNSLRVQTHPDFEIIVADNGSTDGSIVGWGRQTEQADGSTVVMVEANGGARFELVVDVASGQWRLRRAWWQRRAV